MFVIAVLWQITAWLIDNPILWPHLHQVLIKLFDLLVRANFLEAVINSVWMTASAFAIVSVTMIVIIMITWKQATVKQFVLGLSDMLAPTPTMAWLPVFLIFFGFSKTTIYLLMAWGVLWIFLPNLYVQIDVSVKTWHRQVRDLHLNSWQAMIKVYLPAMMPGLIALSKTYFMFLWRVLFAIEIVFGAVGGHIGIGTTMYDFKGKFDHVEVYACLLMIMILGSLISGAFRVLQNKFS